MLGRGATIALKGVVRKPVIVFGSLVEHVAPAESVWRSLLRKPSSDLTERWARPVGRLPARSPDMDETGNALICGKS